MSLVGVALKLTAPIVLSRLRPITIFTRTWGVSPTMADRASFPVVVPIFAVMALLFHIFLLCSSLIPLLRSSRRPSVSIGGFGVSQRREGANRLYVSLLVGLMVFLAALVRFGLGDTPERLVIATVGSFGVLLAVSWFIVIRSYKQLNSEKFRVLHELEQHLAFQFFIREWDPKSQGQKSNRYWETNKRRIDPSGSFRLAVRWARFLCVVLRRLKARSSLFGYLPETLKGLFVKDLFTNGHSWT